MTKPQHPDPSDLLGVRAEVADAEARLADLQKRHAPAEDIARVRQELDALHRYDSVFTPRDPKE